MSDFDLKCDALTLHMILRHIKCLEAFEKIEIFLALVHSYYALIHLYIAQYIFTFIKLWQQFSGLLKSVSLLIAMVMHCQKSVVHFADAGSLHERIPHKINKLIYK